ncbi:VOC family protein [Pseudooceanicola sp. 216_PA32_1]|uniref:VOC family protein n=1 Tax=Pseudooceanicola pacificus TaxID=2676438 RepID=A0A844W433_9RHOB|nr:VOC family protein [Pseudooceanicola pacificus]MWB78976.1 VOC family protein [Pseudooceanicola pacificus]
MASLAPFVMFQGTAAEAVETYCAILPDARAEVVQNDGAGAPQLWRLEVAGTEIMVLDSPAVHDFDLTASLSFYLTCDSSEEVDRLYAALAEDGKVMMPLDSYPFAERYAWVTDRFGLSWQIRTKT